MSEWRPIQQFGPNLYIYRSQFEGFNYFVVKGALEGTEANLDLEGDGNGFGAFITFLQSSKEVNTAFGQITAGNYPAGFYQLLLDCGNNPERGVAITGGFGSYSLWQFGFDYNLYSATIRDTFGNLILSETTLGPNIITSSLTSLGPLTGLTVSGDTLLQGDLDCVDITSQGNITLTNPTGQITSPFVYATTYLNLPPFNYNLLLPITLDVINNRVGINQTNPAFALDVVGAINTSTLYEINGVDFVASRNTGSVALGPLAGTTNQGVSAIAVGNNSGNNGQGLNGIAIGLNSGSTTQGSNSICIGNSAGNASQGQSSVAIGLQAGQTTQGGFSVALGPSAGRTTQGGNCIAIGNNAGVTNQVGGAIAIGTSSGNSSQGSNSVALGYTAGQTSQGASSVAIGNVAGNSSQGIYTVAIGERAGNAGQGNYSVAIGFQAGLTNQHANTTVINSSTTALNTDGTSRLYINPIRNIANTNFLQYNITTKEITYSTTFPQPTQSIVYASAQTVPAGSAAATTLTSLNVSPGTYSVTASLVIQITNNIDYHGSYNLVDSLSNYYAVQTLYYKRNIDFEYYAMINATFTVSTTRDILFQLYADTHPISILAGQTPDYRNTQMRVVKLNL